MTIIIWHILRKRLSGRRTLRLSINFYQIERPARFILWANKMASVRLYRTFSTQSIPSYRSISVLFRTVYSIFPPLWTFPHFSPLVTIYPIWLTPEVVHVLNILLGLFHTIACCMCFLIGEPWQITKKPQGNLLDDWQIVLRRLRQSWIYKWILLLLNFASSCIDFASAWKLSVSLCNFQHILYVQTRKPG
jgi:hypothetical protein